MKLLSYCELRKNIDSSKCILNNETLDYLESLLEHEISVLDIEKNDSYVCDYLCQLKFFKNLVLYNLYKSSTNLVVSDMRDYIGFNDCIDRFSIDYIKNNIRYSIYSLNYGDDIPNVELYSKSKYMDRSYSNDNVLKYIEDDMIIASEKERILNRFLVDNNLRLSDFDDVNSVKIKKYPYANIYIK